MKRVFIISLALSVLTATAACAADVTEKAASVAQEEPKVSAPSLPPLGEPHAEPGYPHMELPGPMRIVKAWDVGLAGGKLMPREEPDEMQCRYKGHPLGERAGHNIAGQPDCAPAYYEVAMSRDDDLCYGIRDAFKKATFKRGSLYVDPIFMKWNKLERTEDDWKRLKKEGKDIYADVKDTRYDHGMEISWLKVDLFNEGTERYFIKDSDLQGDNIAIFRGTEDDFLAFLKAEQPMILADLEGLRLQQGLYPHFSTFLDYFVKDPVWYKASDKLGREYNLINKRGIYYYLERQPKSERVVLWRFEGMEKENPVCMLNAVAHPWRQKNTEKDGE